ncbi:hypothetical protein [Actinoplanes sp. G11-F43]
MPRPGLTAGPDQPRPGVLGDVHTLVRTGSRLERPITGPATTETASA